MTSEEYKSFLTQQLLRLKGAQPIVFAKTPRGSEKGTKTVGLTEYEVGAVIGQGAYAVVRTAIYKPTHTPVALKTYEKYKLLDPHRKQGVNREIKVLSQMTHPHIVKLRDVIDCPNQLHLALELVPGVPLYRYLRQQPGHRLSETQARDFFREVLSAISYCHNLSIAHRDIKLENVLLDPDSHVKVIDFGFATQGDKRSRLFCGTPSYMSPEIVMRREYSAFEADIWALGVMLYAMLCGEMPFRGRNDRDLYTHIQRAQFRLPEFVSSGAKGVISAALAKKPEDRPTADSLLNNPWVTGTYVEPRGCGVALQPVQPKVLSTHSSAIGAGCESSDVMPQCLSAG